MSQKSQGNRYEAVMAMKLKKRAWVHNFNGNYNGTPADLLMVKDGKAVLADCKHCSRNTFDFKRIEPNQFYAMKLFMENGGDAVFFLGLNTGETYVMSLDLAMKVKGQFASMNENMIRTLPTMDEWMEGVRD